MFVPPSLICVKMCALYLLFYIIMVGWFQSSSLRLESSAGIRALSPSSFSMAARLESRLALWKNKIFVIQIYVIKILRHGDE